MAATPLRRLSIVLLSSTALTLVGCQSDGSNRGVIVGAGVVAGAVAGALLGGDTEGRIIGALIGAAVGGILADQFARYLSRRDAQQATEAVETVATAEKDTSSWESADVEGVKGSATLRGQSMKTKQAAIPVAPEAFETLDEMPVIELIGEPYRATVATDVYQGPGTQYGPAKIDPTLAKGEVVRVIGKVQNENWYLIAQGDKATGFVSTTVMAEAPEAKADLPMLADKGTETKTAETIEICRMVEHRTEIPGEADRVEQITACRGPNGWEIRQV